MTRRSSTPTHNNNHDCCSNFPDTTNSNCSEIAADITDLQWLSSITSAITSVRPPTAAPGPSPQPAPVAPGSTAEGAAAAARSHKSLWNSPCLHLCSVDESLGQPSRSDPRNGSGGGDSGGSRGGGSSSSGIEVEIAIPIAQLRHWNSPVAGRAAAPLSEPKLYALPPRPPSRPAHLRPVPQPLPQARPQSLSQPASELVGPADGGDADSGGLGASFGSQQLPHQQLQQQHSLQRKTHLFLSSRSESAHWQQRLTPQQHHQQHHHHQQQQRQWQQEAQRWHCMARQPFEFGAKHCGGDCEGIAMPPRSQDFAYDGCGFGPPSTNRLASAVGRSYAEACAEEERRLAMRQQEQQGQQQVWSQAGVDPPVPRVGAAVALTAAAAELSSGAVRREGAVEDGRCGDGATAVHVLNGDVSLIPVMGEGSNGGPRVFRNPSAPALGVGIDRVQPPSPPPSPPRRGMAAAAPPHLSPYEETLSGALDGALLRPPRNAAVAAATNAALGGARGAVTAAASPAGRATAPSAKLGGPATPHASVLDPCVSHCLGPAPGHVGGGGRGCGTDAVLLDPAAGASAAAADASPRATAATVPPVTRAEGQAGRSQPAPRKDFYVLTAGHGLKVVVLEGSTGGGKRRRPGATSNGAADAARDCALNPTGAVGLDTGTSAAAAPRALCSSGAQPHRGGSYPASEPWSDAEAEAEPCPGVGSGPGGEGGSQPGVELASGWELTGTAWEWELRSGWEMTGPWMGQGLEPEPGTGLERVAGWEAGPEAGGGRGKRGRRAAQLGWAARAAAGEAPGRVGPTRAPAAAGRGRGRRGAPGGRGAGRGHGRRGRGLSRGQ